MYVTLVCFMTITKFSLVCPTLKKLKYKSVDVWFFRCAVKQKYHICWSGTSMCIEIALRWVTNKLI